MKLKTNELINIFNILDGFLILSKAFTDTYKEYVRLFSNGDGKLYFISNNCEDFKIIQNVDIDRDIQIDKIYLINEMSNIIKNSVNYSELELIDDIIYFVDGKFTLFVINSIDEEKKEQLFNINKHNVEKHFIVDGDLEDEIKDIFMLLNLKSTGGGNSYFYKDGSLFFNFNALYVKKESIISFIITDILSLRLISRILLKYKGSMIKYDNVNQKLIMNSDSFYLETSIFNEDTNSINYLTHCFENIEEENTINLKMEFANFVNAINTFDPESTLTFKNEEVIISSVHRKHVANFNIENINTEFIISTEILFKILSYIIKFKNINTLIFKLIRIKDNKFLQFEHENIKILTEII
jgi:hypothetical protein